ncbi:hypothetical protein TI04_02720 [Achromatium sp. WMS2]|nr:hypothetical protein TI04_02720 [Achromatium sp. WMS2]
MSTKGWRAELHTTAKASIACVSIPKSDSPMMINSLTLHLILFYIFTIIYPTYSIDILYRVQMVRKFKTLYNLFGISNQINYYIQLGSKAKP